MLKCTIMKCFISVEYNGLTESLRTVLDLLVLNYDDFFTPREKKMFEQKKNAYLRWHYENNKHLRLP